MRAYTTISEIVYRYRYEAHYCVIDLLCIRIIRLPENDGAETIDNFIFNIGFTFEEVQQQFSEWVVLETRQGRMLLENADGQHFRTRHQAVVVHFGVVTRRALKIFETAC